MAIGKSRSLKIGSLWKSTSFSNLFSIYGEESNSKKENNSIPLSWDQILRLALVHVVVIFFLNIACSGSKLRLLGLSQQVGQSETQIAQDQKKTYLLLKAPPTDKSWDKANDFSTRVTSMVVKNFLEDGW